MKTNELKINNIVWDVNNVPKTIKSITSYGDLAFVCFEAEMHRLPTQEIRPIIPTEEWLVKFGFEEQGIDKRTFCSAFVKDGFRITLSNGGNFYYGKLMITSIHQLQNLFFCLRGEELFISKSE
jgi:hypothetical protein